MIARTAANYSAFGTHAYLEARGFSATGERTGGILQPREVLIPASSVLFRLYDGVVAGPNGRWWTTPHELDVLLRSAGHTRLDLGAVEGRSLLHGLLAVIPEWGNKLTFCTAIQLALPLGAYYGESDDATLGATGGRKAGWVLVDGKQRRARQLFIPGFAAVESAATIRIVSGVQTGTNLPRMLAQRGTSPLHFEQ